jgi:hypothetical protein
MDLVYIQSAESLEAVARQVRDVAFLGCDIQERDGLNMGGGRYFLIYSGHEEAVVCFSDYGDSPSPHFNLLMYLRKGQIERLVNAATALASAGVSIQVEAATRPTC